MRSVWQSFVAIWDSDDYRRYLRVRGFRAESGWPLVRRGFLECWAQPGLHRFWRLWNPGLGFLTFRLYRMLGGGPVAKITVFLFSGLVHNAVVAPVLGWSLVLPVTFGCFGALVVLGPLTSRLLRQASWPTPFNVLVNAALVVGSFDVGFRLHDAVTQGFG